MPRNFTSGSSSFYKWGERMLSRNKIAIIHVAKLEIGLSDGEYRDILNNNFKVESSTKLSNFQFEKLMIIFKKLGFRQIDKITIKQRYRIEEYTKKLKWDEARLKGFIKRQIGIEKNVEKLRKEEASKLITGLKKLERRLSENEKKQKESDMPEMS